MATLKTRVEYENRTRTRWVFAHPDHPEKGVIVGSSADRIVQGERDPVYQASPVLTLTGEQDGKFPAHERKTIDALVTRGDFQRRELAA